MLDYEAVSALAAVLETQGFQTAAEKLFITQSAISQRIRNLENYYGEPVIIRTQPYRPTALGERLLGHFNRVSLLEEGLKTELTAESQSPRISIAISRDSLETWFIKILDQLKNISPIKLDIIADDQEKTLEYLQRGLVSACASTTTKPLSGCKAEFLGYFDYVLVASPEFKNKYFKNKKNSKDNLAQAPFVIFDNKDELHAKYLKHFFNITNLVHNHMVPSVAGFRQFAINGYAYALIPKIDITQELKQGKLMNLFPDKIWRMPVYWHSWAIETKAYKLFNQLVSKVAQNILQ